MRPPITQRCLKTTFFSLKTNQINIQRDFGGLDLQYKTQEIGFPCCEIEKATSGTLKGRKFERKNMGSYEPKVLN